MSWTALLIAQIKLYCIYTKINLKASVVRYHMHTRLKVRKQIYFDTVTNNFK